MVKSNRLLRTAVVATVAVTAGLAAAWTQQRSNNAESERRFESMTRHLAERISMRMSVYEFGLRGLRGMVMAAGGTQVTAREVRDYSSTLDNGAEFRGTHGFGVIFRVREGGEAAFEKQARLDGRPDFRIKRLAPHVGESEVVEFAEPIENNRIAIGLDIASEPGRHDAAMAAMINGQATLTEPIALLQAGSRAPRNFLLLLPLFQPDRPTGTPAQRESALIGWTYSSLISAEALDGLDTTQGQLSFVLHDRSGAHDVEFHRQGDADPQATGPAHHASLSIYGRQWDLETRPTVAFAAAQRLPDPAQAGLTSGAVMGLLATALSLLLQSRRRQKQDWLEKARRWAIVESSEDAIVAETLSGVIIEWNGGAERLFGYTAEEAIGQIATGLILPMDRSQEDARMRVVTSRGERLSAFDTTRLHRDGTLIDVSIAAAPILDETGRCIGFAKTLRDIRPTQAARLALSQLNDSLEKQVRERTVRLNTALRDLRAILDAVPSMIGYWDRRLTNRVANRAYADWYGMTPDELHGRSLHEISGQEFDGRLGHHVESALRGVPQNFERAVADPVDQRERRFLVHYLPDVLGDEVQGFYVMIHDITEITENQRALANAQRENTAILETLHRHALVSVADRAGRIIEVNESFCRVSGFAPEELRGQNHRIINSGVHDKAFWQDMWRSISAGEVWHGEVCNRAKDGTLYWVDSVIAPFFDARGRIEKYVSIRTDITASKRLQQEAEEARSRANLANQAKSQFLANMSHEIRTPMNAVIGLSYLLQRTRLSDEQSGFAGKIGLAGKALLSLINDILDLSKIEASEMTLEDAPFSLRDIVSEVAAVVGAQAEAKAIGFDVDLPGDIPDALMGDSTRVRQVLLNLLGNSVKFTQQGRVTLKITRTAARAEPGDVPRVEIAFRVADTGIGMEEGHLERLFQPFAQADASTTRRFGGTGLGLSIVRQLIDLMKGTIDVRSQPGIGSEFTVRTRFAFADPATLVAERSRKASVANGRSLEALAVLVVDDSDINLEVARRILESEGGVVELARNGREAVDLLRERPDRADIVLMDLQMPVMDGHQAAACIRSELGLAPDRLPIIALTAGMTTGEHERATAAGMNGVVGKPFDPDVLLARLLQAVGRDARTQPPACPLPVPASAALDWPTIDGVDTADVSLRLRGDTRLFRSLLSRFLEDTDRTTEVLARGHAPAAAAMAMHSLRGTAATLGARMLAMHAGRVEERCLEEPPGLAPEDCHELILSLNALRRAARAHLREHASSECLDAEQAGSLPAATVARLREQLRLADLGALDTLQRYATALRHHLGETDFAALSAHCDSLRFSEAEAILAGVVVS